jgi:hypothetical protein
MYEWGANNTNSFISMRNLFIFLIKKKKNTSYVS